jgi:hypothetical protein
MLNPARMNTLANGSDTFKTFFNDLFLATLCLGALVARIIHFGADSIWECK